MEVKPTYFPSVPRMFEKIYTLANANAEDPELLKKAVEIGLEVRQRQERGEPVPPDMQQAFDQAEEKLFVNVRNLFGGRIRQCVTGAAPIAGEILEFFYACGIPVMEGYGMTETSTVATVNTPEEHRFGSVGKPLPGVEVKIGDDGEVLIKGPNIFQGYYKNDEATAETLEAELAAHGRPGAARRRRLPLHHRPQEGHHHHRGRQEHHAGEPGERAQAEPLDLAGRGGRRPAAVPDRAGHARPRGGARVRRRARPRGRDAARVRGDARRGPEGRRRGQLARRAGRADQEVRDPRPRPVAGDRRADADAQGQAQRGQREVRRPRRPGVRRR